MKVKFHLEKNKQPTTDNGMKVLYGNAKRSGYRIRWYAILALVLSPIFAMLYYFFQQYVLTIAPGIITTEPVILTASQDAVVESINIKEGDEVSSNQFLMELKDSALDNDIIFLRHELKKIKVNNKIKKDNLTYYTLAIDNAKSSFININRIKINYDKYIKEGKVSQVDYAAILGMYSNAQNLVTNANIMYSKAKIDDNQRDIAGAIAGVIRNLNKELVTKLSQYDSLFIRSPYIGNIVEINAVIGQRVKEGDYLATVSSKLPPFVIAYLNPKYIDKAKEGSLVTIILPSGVRLKGEVSLAIKTASKLPTQLAKPFEGTKALLKVKVNIINELNGVSWVEGMPVNVSF